MTLKEADLDVLSRSRLFSTMSAEDLASFYDELDQVAVPPRTTIIREGDAGDYLYFVLSGEAEISRGDFAIGPASTGAHFGELSIVGALRRAASVTSVTAMRLARLSKRGYESLRERNPALAVRFVEGLLATLGTELVSMTDSMGELFRQRSLPRHARVKITRDDGGEPLVVGTGTPVAQLLPEYVQGARVVAALTDQRPVSMDAPVISDTRLAPVTMASWEGREVYRRSACLVLLEAARRVAPEARVSFGPSVGPGRVLHTATPELGPEIACAYTHLLAQKAPLREELWGAEEAASHFARQRDDGAARLIQHWRDPSVPLVRCGDTYAISPGPLLPHAGWLEPVTLVPHPAGLLVAFGAEIDRWFPAPGSLGDALQREVEKPRFGDEMTRERTAWLRTFGVDSVGAFNAVCVSGQVRELIRVSEGYHEKRIGRLADRISAQGGVRVIGIAGPSSSGKTTFIKRLSVQLQIVGLFPVEISLDNYYVDREKTPRDEHGDYDFEAFLALDLELLQDHLRRLVLGEAVRTAKYDFRTGISHREGGPELRLGPHDVLVLEGIHGLNPELVADVVPRAQVFTVFVHPSDAMPFDALSTISPADVRLLRRIVRDRHTRGYKAAENIARWASVRRGEHLHIYPNHPNADSVFDTSLPYELSVLKVYAERYLLEVPAGHPSFATAYRLRHLVDRFVAIYPEHVPPTSILREFIGGSGFEY